MCFCLCFALNQHPPCTFVPDVTVRTLDRSVYIGYGSVGLKTAIILNC